MAIAKQVEVVNENFDIMFVVSYLNTVDVMMISITRE